MGRSWQAMPAPRRPPAGAIALCSTPLYPPPRAIRPRPPPAAAPSLPK